MLKASCCHHLDQMADIQLTTTTTAAEILFGGCFQSGIVLSRQETSGDHLGGAGEEGLRECWEGLGGYGSGFWGMGKDICTASDAPLIPPQNVDWK